MNKLERSTLYLQMVGDYKKYSLNPSGRKDPEHRAPNAVPAPPAADAIENFED